MAVTTFAAESLAEGVSHPTLAELEPGSRWAQYAQPPWHAVWVIDELRAAANALNRGDPDPLASLFAEDAQWRGVSHGHLWWKRTSS